MSDTKWTKGEWVADGNVAYSLQDCVWRGMPSKENRFYAQVHGHKCEDYELDANANLIAAAPELYEALEQLVITLDSSGMKIITVDAHAALAKARGE